MHANDTNNTNTPGASFLQSPEWEKFQQAFGRKTWRIDNFLIIRHDLPFGFSYLYCPRPKIENPDKSLKSATADFRDLGLKEKSIFLKLEPEMADPEYLTSLGFIKSKKEIQPLRTLVLDLEKTEDELLAAMHKKTRYDIRVAQKHGAAIRELNLGDLGETWRIFRVASSRNRFHLHPRSYYEKMIEVLRPSGFLKIFGAFFDEELVAVVFTIFYNKCAIYIHGAFDHDQKGLGAPHLLNWHIIREAKKLGFQKYDFWGISEKYPGVTRFKRRFGGDEVVYPGSFDLVLCPVWYNSYKLVSNTKSKISKFNLYN